MSTPNDGAWNIGLPSVVNTRSGDSFRPNSWYTLLAARISRARYTRQQSWPSSWPSSHLATIGRAAPCIRLVCSSVGWGLCGGSTPPHATGRLTLRAPAAPSSNSDNGSSHNNTSAGGDGDGMLSGVAILLCTVAVVGGASVRS